MTKLKDQMIRLVRDKARREVARVAGEFARAASEEREQIFAELQFNRWLAESCSDSLGED